ERAGLRSPEHRSTDYRSPIPGLLSALLGHPEALVHDRARRRVLQRDFLGGVEMGCNAKRGQCSFMKTRQDQFLLAWIGIDVAHRKNTRNVRLKFFGVDDDRSFVELQPPVGNWAEPRMQAEENERMVRLELDELALSRLHAHAAELPSLDKNRMRDPFHVAHAAIGDELLHLRHGRWCRAKLGSTMDQSETARLACQFQRPVERRVATAEDQQSLPGEIRRALHPVMDMAALECLRSFATEPARLKRTEPRRDDHRLGMETRIERRAHQE